MECLMGVAGSVNQSLVGGGAKKGGWTTCSQNVLRRALVMRVVPKRFDSA